MSRNRVIYNVQDVLIGSFPDEKSASITGLANHQILQRINKVQSFGYGINTNISSESVLGSSSTLIQEYPVSPEISIDFSYLVNGINNELRMGLNPVITSFVPKFERVGFLSSLLTENETLGRNIYLITKNNNNDAHGQDVQYPSLHNILGQPQKSYIEHPDSHNFGVAIFQNSYLTKYSVAGGIDKLTTVNVSYVSDNFLGYSHGDNLNIPDLNLKNGTVVNRNEKFVIPKTFGQGGLCNPIGQISKPSKIQLNIVKSKQTTVNFLNNDVVDFSLDIDITRENINYVGHKMPTKKLMKFPIFVDFNINMIYQNDPVGSFTENIKEKETYNVILDLKNDLNETLCKYTLLGCVLDSVKDDGSIGENRSMSLSFKTDIDFERDIRGIFVEGKVDEICDIITSDNGINLTDDNNAQLLYGLLATY